MQQYAEQLKKGKTVQFRPRGNSMAPRINSGELITVSPELGELKKGDIVLCKVAGQYYVHLIKAIRTTARLRDNGKRRVRQKYQIGNNRGGINGWIGKGKIFGRVTKIEK